VCRAAQINNAEIAMKEGAEAVQFGELQKAVDQFDLAAWLFNLAGATERTKDAKDQAISVRAQLK